MKKKNDTFTGKLKVFIFLLILSQTFYCWAQQQKLPELPTKVYQDVSAATAKIICNNGEKIGSGSIVGITREGRALILTAAHVVMSNFDETDPEIDLEFYDRIEVKIQGELEPIKASVLTQFVDRDNDLALIATTRSVSGNNVMSYTRSDKVKREQNVRALGFPQTDELTQTVGKIIRLEPKYLVFDANIDKGSSGGPLIDENGWMIGLSSSIVHVEGKKEGYAIPANLVASVVNVWLNQTALKKKWRFEHEQENRRKIWPWLAGVGVAGGVTAYFLLGDKPPKKATLVITVEEPPGN